MSQALAPLTVRIPQPPSFDDVLGAEAPTGAELFPEYNMCWACNDIQLRCTCWPRDAHGQLIPADEYCASCGGNCCECDCQENAIAQAAKVVEKANPIAAPPYFKDTKHDDYCYQCDNPFIICVCYVNRINAVSTAEYSDACICNQSECICELLTYKDYCLKCDRPPQECYCQLAAQINAEIEMEEAAREVRYAAAADQWEREHDLKLLEEQEKLNERP